VEDPSIGADTGDRATWTESLLQAGVAGTIPVGAGGLYGFGAVTGIGVVSYGQDIFRDSTRSSLDLEKAYAGVLYAPDDSDLRLRLSLGRQNYSLNNGFLVSQFGSQWNAGPRPGVYMAPRTTQDQSVLASASYGGWKATFFSLDPNELESIESDTRLQGLNLVAPSLGRWSWDISSLHVPESKTAYRAPDGLRRSREGLWTAAGHLRMRSRPQGSSFWFESELAHQWHDEFSMDAWAGYAELGYYARDARWAPSVSYRYAAFTGDDPATGDYERFDTLYSGGLDHWLQGISINKLLTQSNRLSHRLRLNLSATPRLNLTFDAYRHTADQRNNLGANPALGTLASRDLGDEIQLTARWQLRPNVLVLGIASAAFAGEAIEAAADGDADPWNTLQMQVFWGF
ncbi:MAG: alginate export family protein, partial [Halieaceae bacterium]|nr:alginate export family protein [Halieaceae bacterium]